MILGRFCRSGQYSLYIAHDLEKQTLASNGTKSQCHPAHPTSLGQEILDFKAWTEEKLKLTIELKRHVFKIKPPTFVQLKMHLST